MSPKVYLCIVSSIRIAYCFVGIAIRIVSDFFRIDPALVKMWFTQIVLYRLKLIMIKKEQIACTS